METNPDNKIEESQVNKIEEVTLMEYQEAENLLSEGRRQPMNLICPNSECQRHLVELYRQIDGVNNKKVFTYTFIRVCVNPDCVLGVNLDWIESNTHWRRREVGYVYPIMTARDIKKSEMAKAMARLNRELGEDNKFNLPQIKQKNQKW